eukprot:2875126-Pyramimonas_sp.AAC.1
MPCLLCPGRPSRIAAAVRHHPLRTPYGVVCQCAVWCAELCYAVLCCATLCCSVLCEKEKEGEVCVCVCLCAGDAGATRQG